MWTLGIESTAHTLSFGLVDKEGIPFPSSSATIRPEKGGIHPREAADHHKDCAAELLSNLLDNNSLYASDISAVAYSQGPGLDHVFVLELPLQEDYLPNLMFL